MSNPILPRRTVFRGALLAAAAAFNPVGRSWASETRPGFISPPPLDGQLLLDDAARTAAAEDYGHIVHHRPWAVLVPGSVNDIVKMVRFARSHGLRIAGSSALGDSHSTQGQAQVAAGIVIDMSALSTLHSIDATSAWVDAGVQWLQLLNATVLQGKSPPTLTDYLELSIGGTLSVGGIGGQAFRSGLQVDNVLELEVVTGRGDLVRCSPTSHKMLFDSVRGGLGQFGIIVRARIRLVAVPSHARTYTALYNSLPAFLADQKSLTDDGRFDYVEGSVVTAADGSRSFQLETVRYFDPRAPPDDAALLAGLAFQPGTARATDTSYFDFVNRLAPLVAFLKAQGLWSLPHPWLNVFVPQARAATFVQYVLDNTPPEEIGEDPVLLYAFRPSRLTAPFVRVPLGSHAFLFSLLRTANPGTPGNVAALLAKNQLFLDKLKQLGGKAYPISSGPRTPAEWRQHFGVRWPWFAIAKRAFDPDNVLTPGQGIFA
ncbi:FAD-binding protein [Melittangium boletus]|uniref:Oxidoreductase n=1 Tax=Melittangium boletus DSM 14713 TaxID=1294270 RepID=A0A250IPW8_9BACT|nr:FAD-binding protein [Melittangium boletus]ATB32986.1 oxidoreductase [Melittangium boletus DSM 14713]